MTEADLLRNHQCYVNELVKSRLVDGVVKSAKIKAREFRVLKAYLSTPQGQRDEAQRRYWTFYGVVNIETGAMVAHILKIKAAMTDPGFYPHPVGAIEVSETHISMVFLTGERVYKIKKPFDLGFLDFSTLAKREEVCRKEVRLNRRLSDRVYLGVVAVTIDPQGGYRLQGSGPVAEYAVCMRQLPAERTLQHLLAHGEIDSDDIDRLAGVLHRFYRHAVTGDRVKTFGTPAFIETNCEENFQQTAEFVGQYIDGRYYAIIRAATRAFISQRQSVFQKRLSGDCIRDGHGDLRCEHIYYTTAGIQIIDCIEFNDRFRFGDTANDLAFLTMDLDMNEHGAMACRFIEAYVRQAGDHGLYAVLIFYKCYRAMVRVKVDCLHLRQGELNVTQRSRLENSIHRHLALAHHYALFFSRPIVWVLCGWIAAGKSTLALALSDALSLPVLNSDRIRKELFGRTPTGVGRVEFETRAYSPQATALTYRRMLQAALAELQKGGSVIVDATFHSRAQREDLRRLAKDMHIKSIFVFCSCDEAQILERLRRRERETGVSDARSEHWPAFISRFEPLQEIPSGRLIHADTGQPIEWNLERILNRFAYG